MEKSEKLFNKSTSELLKKTPNHQLVVKLMEESYALGFAMAGYALATWYLHGTYYKQNIKKGVQLLRVAAQENIIEAFFDLAVAYETGQGIKKNEAKAFEYYLKAALNGDIDAMVSMGRLYSHGIGVAKSKSIAGIWLNKAEELGARW